MRRAVLIDWTNRTRISTPRTVVLALFAVLLALLLVRVVMSAAGTALAPEDVDTVDADEAENSVTASDAFNTTVYVGSEQGTIYAVDVEGDTPEQRWAFNVGEDLEASPTVADGTVYAAGVSGDCVPGEDCDEPPETEPGLYAIDAETGDFEWEFTDTGSISGSPTVVDGTVYIAEDVGGNVYALDADTGDQEWSEDIETTVRAAPHVVDDHVYVSGYDINDGGLFALDRDTGDLEWQFENPEYRIDTTPTVHDGVVYFGVGTETQYDPDGEGILYAVDAENGTELSTYENPVAQSGFVGSPTVVDAADGDSVGSRVAQGILGHTDSFPQDGTIEGQVTDPAGEPIAGATVDVASEPMEATTDGDGEFELAVPSGEHTLEVDGSDVEAVTVTTEVGETDSVTKDLKLAPTHRVGDVENGGEIEITDAVRIQQELAGLDPEPFDPTLADVDRTGEITIADAVLIQQYLADLREPGETSIEAVSVGADTTSDDTIEVTAQVENTGGMGALQTAEHRFADEDALDEQATRAVDGLDLGPGDETELTFTVDTTTLESGTYYYELHTDDDSEVVTIDLGADNLAASAEPLERATPIGLR